MSLSDIASSGSSAEISLTPLNPIVTYIRSIGEGLQRNGSPPAAVPPPTEAPPPTDVYKSGTAIITMADSTKHQLDADVEEMKIRLPIMESCQKQDKQVAMVYGKLMPDNGGDLFNTAFRTTTVLPVDLDAVVVQLNVYLVPAASELSAFPGARLTDKLIAASGLDLSTVLASNAALISTYAEERQAYIAAMFTAQTNAKNTAIRKLQSMSFVKFASSPRPSCSEGLLDTITNVPDSLKVELLMMQAAGAILYEQQDPKTSPSNPAATFPPRKVTVETQVIPLAEVDAFKASLTSKLLRLPALLADSQEKSAICTQWQITHQYFQVKDYAVAHPEDAAAQSAFETLRSQFEAEVYNTFLSSRDVYNAAKNDVDSSLNSYFNRLIGYPT